MNESELNKNTDPQVNKSVGSGTPPPPVPQLAAPKSHKKLFITLAIVGGAIITITIAVMIIIGIRHTYEHNLTRLIELEEFYVIDDEWEEEEEIHIECLEDSETLAEIYDDTDTREYTAIEIVEEPEYAVTEENPISETVNANENSTSDENFVFVEEVTEEKAPEEVFTAVEQMPRFPGGEGELMKYISSHIKYPTMAAENNIQGRVVVMFVVTKTGKIGEVKVVRSKDPDLDKEAIRVVKTLPDFIPGKMNGQAVNTWYTVPVTFKLQ